jgi:PIN domain nuclease of toxin-antitoxin system
VHVSLDGVRSRAPVGRGRRRRRRSGQRGAAEIGVKHELGKLALDRPPELYVPEERARHGVEALALDEDSTLRVHRLPAVHRDPFDRMLVCQALAGGLVIVTPDPRIARYPARVLW